MGALPALDRTSPVRLVDELQTVDSPEALKQAADCLDEQCEELRARAREIALEATAMRRRALEVEIEPPPHALDDLNGHRSPAEKILAILTRTGEPQKMSVILTILGESEAHTRATIGKLVERDLVVREGLKRGTTYRVPREGETVEAPALTSQRYETTVRDAARRLGVFTFAEIAEDVPVSPATLRRWLAAWVEQGALECERVGKGYLYACVKPKGSHPTHAPRSAPKPWEAPEGCERVRIEGVSSRGRKRRSLGGAVAELEREARKHGVEVEREAGGHLRWIVPGKGYVRSSSTPGASSMKDTRAKLRKLGVPV